MSETDQAPVPPEPVRDYKRKFLVVIDDTEECDRAVTFAAGRVKRTGGTVVLLSVIESEDFTQFLGVEEVMRAEAREAAETLLDQRIARINEIGGVRTETVIREGRPVEEIEKVIAADSSIAILVLAASASNEGPGPLVSAFATRSGAKALPLLITIVPGALTDEQIAALT
ncbi:Nucleotide-binding universal stress protein, UspA family [Devosia enhydra]|uniref:Nucleotide-binding universal stress protein, UspA family n=1 Tax=Devosia enhydra TaxID=665118 RepID=A0A1K2HYF4_9HYPH|nr:universal stress protein [Devosia enhydra]SFZ84879.1 Nucleotide-binding universal stress protein, UspA family [Devosia enhydra]